MADMLATGSAWLNGIQKSHSAHTVEYRRGEDAVELLATIGQTIFKQRSEYGAIIFTESRDFLITAADLTLGEPERGDQIIETLVGSEIIYEVMAPGDEHHFRYSDTDRRMLRVHTKCLGVV